jgi:RNA polymerase sigma factor (sigma-70 family)
MPEVTPEHLSEADLLAGCARGDLRCQKQLYKRYYGLAMHLCLRYAATREEAAELLNDGFMKVFTNLHNRTGGSFEGWLRRIMVNTAIDHFRRQQHHNQTLDLLYAENRADDHTADAIAQLSAAEIMQLVQQLTPACRIVFNLYVIEGYTHVEVGEKLGISEGASKSNLHKARMKLQRMIQHLHGPHGGYVPRTGTD